MQVVVVANGEPLSHDIETVRRRCAEADIVIAADGGLRHCVALGVRPNHLVGDLDSAPPALVEEAGSGGVAINAHPTDKDATDLELALELALELGATSISVVAPFGGRLDHELATVSLLASPRWKPVNMCAIDGRRTLWVVHESITLTLAIGTTVSLVPAAGDAKGVCATGLQWPLTDAELRAGTTLGVSNVAVAPEQSISLARGVLLAVVDALEAE